MENITGCLRPISGAEILTLEPTDGTETIAQARDLFTGRLLDPDFKDWGCDVKSEPTGKVNVIVHEMVKDETFAQIFSGLSEDLDKSCLTQAQIVQFMKKYRRWLRTDGYATFFLFKVGSKFFVARVRLYSDGRREAYVYHFLDDHVGLPRTVIVS